VVPDIDEADAEFLSSISIRASAMSCNRFCGFFRTDRSSSVRIDAGVWAGSATMGPYEVKAADSVLGYTLAARGERGSWAYVFWWRLQRASQKFTTSIDKVLAVAIAHELGHMLLPDGKHA
jgi:hypothetical protein